MIWQTLVHRAISWSELESLQKRLALDAQQNPDNAYLLFSEPRSTFTFGRFASREDLKWSDEVLRANEVSVESVSRGGKWTYHGPGQVVAYPILNLKAGGYTRHAVHGFLNDVRGAVMRYLQSLGIATLAKDDPFGVYVGGKKLVSFGISVERGVTRHGLALYLKPQQRYFEGIVACGQVNAASTSLEELGARVDWDTIIDGLGGELVRGLGEKRVFLKTGKELGSGPCLEPLN